MAYNFCSRNTGHTQYAKQISNKEQLNCELGVKQYFHHVHVLSMRKAQLHFPCMGQHLLLFWTKLGIYGCS